MVIFILGTDILGKLSAMGFVLNKELKISVEFLNDLNLLDGDKLFLYGEFKSEIESFIEGIDDKLQEGNFETLEDKSHELKGVTKNLRFDGLAEIFHKIQLNCVEKNMPEVKKNILEFKAARSNYFL
jgi:HPt (histidine-containing phosphotransfer) domain-containing protein